MDENKRVLHYGRTFAGSDKFLQRLLDKFSPSETETILMDLVKQVRENA